MINLVERNILLLREKMKISLHKLCLLLADNYTTYMSVKKWEREVTYTSSVEHICLSFWFEDECRLDKIHIYFFKEGLTAVP